MSSEFSRHKAAMPFINLPNSAIDLLSFNLHFEINLILIQARGQKSAVSDVAHQCGDHQRVENPVSGIQ